MFFVYLLKFQRVACSILACEIPSGVIEPIVQNTIFIGEWFLSTDAFIRLISAHTRERCAKLAHECWENGIPAQEIAQRIRRMED